MQSWIYFSFKTDIRSKYKNSKSIIKVMSKSDLWKEQTRWRMDTAFNNKKKYQWFMFRLCFVVSDWLAIVFFFLLLWPDPTFKKLISLFAGPTWPAQKATYHVPARRGLLENSLLISRQVGKITSHVPVRPGQQAGL